MKDILEDIIAWKRREVEELKYQLPPRELHAIVERAMDTPQPIRSMKGALAQSATGIIAEFKRKSPSKGWIKEDGKAEIIPASYAQNGAAALSILTDEHFFGGALSFIQKARPEVTIPILRKDFIIDEYQLFEARRAQADAVLLIAAALPIAQCRTLLQTAHELQLEVLLEIHQEDELDYAALEPDMLGVNNRHLGSFHTDVQTSFQLASKLPHEMLLVSESGISNPETIRLLRRAGYRGFLMGEHFMRAANPGAALREFVLEI